MIWLIVGLLVSVVANAVMAFLLVRTGKRLLEFDELFVLLEDDIRVNIDYFKKLLQTPLFTNTPEVVTMQQNIEIIARRLEEFTIRIDETTNRELKAP